MINFFERLDIYLKYKGLNDNKFTIETGISNGLIGKARKRGSLSQENISLILYTYPELDANWLFTGKGEMLKNGIVEMPDVKFVDTNFLLDRIEKLAVRNNELEKELEQLKNAPKRVTAAKPYTEGDGKLMLVAEKSK